MADDVPPTVRDWVKRYIARGWPVIPLKHKSKQIVTPGFDMKDPLRFEAEDFRDKDGVGLRGVDGFLVSDCDSDEAVLLSDDFLPPTGAVWGRPGKDRAKRYYKTTNIPKTLGWKDKDGRMIVELRVDHQDVAPPSLHPKGDALAWADEISEVPDIEPVALIRAHRMLATACLILSNYAAAGNRHEWCLALCGLLRKLKFSEEEVIHLLEKIAPYAGETKISDRLLEVRTTYAHDENAPVTGGKTLASHSNEAFVKALTRVWGSVINEETIGRIAELNKIHALLFHQSGEMVVLTEDEKESLRYSKPQVMPLIYPEPAASQRETKQGDTIYRPLGEVWLTHPKRRFYRGIELCPSASEANPDYYNLWRGWGVEPEQKGNFAEGWPLFKEHILLVAQLDPEYARYILSWMAHTVQHPQDPAGIALATRGAPGTGKSTFARWFGALFGEHFLHLDSDQLLLGRFNAHLHNKICVLADEAVWAGGKQGLGRLKRLVTERTLTIERKGIDAITVKNMIHMIVASNEEWFIPTEEEDRRFAIFTISKKRQNNHAFFSAVHDELFKHGGLAALLHDLLHVDLSTLPPLHPIPKTKERDLQKDLTLSPQSEWWIDTLESGAMWTNDGDEQRLERDALYENYSINVEHSQRRFSRGSRGALGRFLRRVLPDGYPKEYRDKSTSARYYVVPSLEVCMRSYEECHGKREWRRIAVEDNGEPDMEF